MHVTHMFITSGHFVFKVFLDVSLVNRNKGTKGRVSQLLREVSRLFPSSFSTTSSLLHPSALLRCSAVILQATTGKILSCAQGMLQENSSVGLCEQLNWQEHLRVTCKRVFKRLTGLYLQMKWCLNLHCLVFTES